MYSKTCSDGLYTIEGVDFTVSYVPVVRMKSLRIFITILPGKGMIIFIVDISNAPQKYI